MDTITRIINGKLIVGQLIQPTKAPKTASIRPKPSKPVYGSRLPPSLERE